MNVDIAALCFCMHKRRHSFRLFSAVDIAVFFLFHTNSRGKGQPQEKTDAWHKASELRSYSKATWIYFQFSFYYCTRPALSFQWLTLHERLERLLRGTLWHRSQCFFSENFLLLFLHSLSFHPTLFNHHVTTNSRYPPQLFQKFTNFEHLEKCKFALNDVIDSDIDFSLVVSNNELQRIWRNGRKKRRQKKMVKFGAENAIPKTTNRKMFIFRKQIAKKISFSIHTHSHGERVDCRCHRGMSPIVFVVLSAFIVYT